MSSLLKVWALPAALLFITNMSATWYKFVSELVPDPYLDEVFHVPQAQRYCQNDHTWDPKITTPPGLYLVSILFKPIAGCETSTLRVLNVGAITLTCFVSYHLLRHLHSSEPANTYPKGEKSTAPITNGEGLTTVFDAHSALNISLFPPMFFFCALYYTDVMSTLAVLLSFHTYVTRKTAPNPVMHDFRAVVIGVLALLFRQTNVFWVAVFPAGLTVVDILLNTRGTTTPTTASTQAIVADAWKNGKMHDTCIADAKPGDLALFLVTTPLAVLGKPIPVMRAIAPYMVILGLFGTFVVWNGGVVLGDKSAHVATIHAPQMLYFWPYMMFFSFPLSLRLALPPIIERLPNRPKALFRAYLTGDTRVARPGLLFAAVFVVFGLAAVHYNTIIHPYTLADNRHYVFYVFRILRRNSALKYLFVPVYYVCAWLSIQTIGCPDASQARMKRSDHKLLPNQTSYYPPSRLSFVVVWVITTTLSVATAPLVEPRYFIVPWIMWRLHTPYLFGPNRHGLSRHTPYDMRLTLETIWFLAVNAVVGYNFLYHGFWWPSEPESVQRFLW